MFGRVQRVSIGLLTLLAVGAMVGTPRVWHAHSDDDPEHQHFESPADGHGHGHSHGHSHRHSHHHSHSHGPHHHHRHTTDVTHDEPVTPLRWHSHVTVLGWTFTLWGPVARPGAKSSAVAASTPAKPSRAPQRLSDTARNARVKVALVPEFRDESSHWLATWSATILLLPPLAGCLLIDQKCGSGTASITNDQRQLQFQQPPVPPPRLGC